MCVTTATRLDRGYSACVLLQTAHAALRMVTSANAIMNGFARIVVNPIISALVSRNPSNTRQYRGGPLHFQDNRVFLHQ